jgi:broad specificity phosphatase PhoE
VSPRLVLVCHGSTEATRRAAFPTDEPLETPDRPLPGGPSSFGRRFEARCGSALRCRQTAEALGLGPVVVDPLLDDWDVGRWRGRTLAEIQAADPDGVVAWFTDPDAAPHGGEPMSALLARVGTWLDGRVADVDHSRNTVAVTHPAVIRAAIVQALRATPESFWRVDVAPLSQVRLSGSGGRWTLTSLVTAGG